VIEMMNWLGGMGWVVWLVMGGFWLLLVALIIFLQVRLLPSGGRSASPGAESSPEDILDRRFARGEIDEATYTAQRVALAKGRSERR
jgi:putative membrane protein